ncbi:hypothetical protein B0O80DRAFT_447685 [Mortierella sp. GBAus27b]|nr:hypothetical protein BGX31_000186 [Mortierella sp. GBA43]KAI8356540.1 hypothetical protein B0O80DRAFT_447685 [Mortierella sp. GBAus27b]
MKLLRNSLSIYAVLLLPMVRVDAQGPLARRRLAFTQLNSTLYLQGGFDTQAYTAQSNALDLSTSWAAASPAWTPLKDGPLTSHHAMVAVRPQYSAGLGSSRDGYLLAIGGMEAAVFWSIFDLQARVWSVLPAVGAAAPPYPGLEGHAAVVDPNSGYVYMVGGFFGNTTYNGLMTFDPSTRTILHQEAATAAASLTDLGAVWSSVRNTIITIGGSRAPPAERNGLDMGTLQEYDPAAKSWKTMVTSGAIPPPRLDHCVAVSDDGSKIVVFGGSKDAKIYYQDVYILDVKSATWRQGSPSSTPRTRMACGFASGQFIAWGGSSGDNRTTTMHNNLPIIYNVDTDAWMTSYTAVAASQTPSSPGSSDNKSSTGPIIGGVVAAVVALIACIVGIYVYRRKKREKLDKDEARMAASLASDEDQQHYRKNPVPKPNQVYAPDSDIDKSTNSSNEQHLGKMRAQDHYAAVDTLRGGRDRVSGGAANAAPGYYDVNGVPSNQGYVWQGSSANPAIPYQQQQQYLQQQQLFQQQQQQQELYQQQQQLYQQQQDLYHHQQHQHQQGLYQQPQPYQQQQGQESPLQPFKPSFDDVRQSGVSNASNLAYLNHSQMSSGSPQSGVDRPEQQNARDSVASTTYSEPRRSPHALQPPSEYVAPPPSSSRPTDYVPPPPPRR